MVFVFKMFMFFKTFLKTHHFGFLKLPIVVFSFQRVSWFLWFRYVESGLESGLEIIILDTPCAAGARSDGLRPHCQQHISHTKQRDPG